VKLGAIAVAITIAIAFAFVAVLCAAGICARCYCPIIDPGSKGCFAFFFDDIPASFFCPSRAITRLTQ